MIIGLGYKAKSGKDTLADYLCNAHGFRKGSFAESLKRAAHEIFGFTDAQLYGDQKELIDPNWKITPRSALQRLGTEGVRNIFGENTWINSLALRMREDPNDRNWVISDMRFMNEVAAIKIWGGFAVRIDRRAAGASGGIENHPSEVELDNCSLWDAIIENNGSLNQLYAKADCLITNWGWT